MKPKYRAEKIGRSWFAMRGEEKISGPLKTKREAASVASRQLNADWRYVCRWGAPEGSVWA